MPREAFVHDGRDAHGKRPPVAVFLSVAMSAVARGVESSSRAVRWGLSICSCSRGRGRRGSGRGCGRGT